MIMKKIVNIVSNIRIDADYVSAYINQLLSLKQEHCLIGKIILVCDYASSVSSLNDWANIDPRVVLTLEKKTDLGVITLEEKCLQWASICNQGIERALDFAADYILFIEADLTFPYDLLDELIIEDLDVCAPVVFLGAGFYDNWGFRDLKGNRLNSFLDLDVFSGPVKLSSVGSCVLFKADIFRSGIRFRGPYETGLLVGVCNDAINMGYSVWMLPHVSIIHPTSAWRKQVWWITEIKCNHSLFNRDLSCRILVSGAYQENLKIAINDYLNEIKGIPLINYKFSFRKRDFDRSLAITITDA